MARRTDHECAYCAEIFDLGNIVIGDDWKVYCSEECARAGEALSRQESERIMKDALPSRSGATQKLIP